MKKTSIFLLAALVATISNQSHANLYDFGISQDAIDQMGDAQCRSYVVGKVRKAEKYDVAVYLLNLATSGLNDADSLGQQHREQNKTWYGMPTREDYALTVGKIAQSGKIAGRISTALLPEGPHKKILSHTMRLADSIGQKNNERKEVLKTWLEKEATALVFKAPDIATGLGVGKAAQFGYVLEKDVDTLRNMDAAHKDNQEAYSSGKRAISSLQRQEKERQRKAEQRIKEIEAKVAIAVQRYCGQSQRTQFFTANEMGLNPTFTRTTPMFTYDSSPKIPEIRAPFPGEFKLMVNPTRQYAPTQTKGYNPGGSYGPGRKKKSAGGSQTGGGCGRQRQPGDTATC